MNELTAIAEINQEIKSIVCVAANISLTANDAIRVAGQVGVNGEGFDMVARELRMFSEKITASMQILSELIDWQVEVNATKRQRMRRLDVSVNAGENRIAPACSGSQESVEEIERLIVSQVSDLRITMRRTVKQCALGLVIARSVNSEAAYGGAMRPALRRIAQDAEAVVGDISVRIKKLELRLREIGV